MHACGARGLVNGTRRGVRQGYSCMVEARIVTRCCMGKVMLMPRINSSNTDLHLPFQIHLSQSMSGWHL